MVRIYWIIITRFETCVYLLREFQLLPLVTDIHCNTWKTAAIVEHKCDIVFYTFTLLSVCYHTVVSQAGSSQFRHHIRFQFRKRAYPHEFGALELCVDCCILSTASFLKKNSHLFHDRQQIRFFVLTVEWKCFCLQHKMINTRIRGLSFKEVLLVLKTNYIDVVHVILIDNTKF